MIVAYAPKHNHEIVKDHVFVQHVGFDGPGDFISGLNEAFANPVKYGPSTSIWIVPGTYPGDHNSREFR